MHPTHDSDLGLTEADRTSQTRFGPRPVPGGHHKPKGLLARRTIPSGRVSPDGRSGYPTPSLGAKIAVWGGVAVGVAGGTAAAVFAIRKLAEAISGDSDDRDGRRRSMAPRFGQMDDDDREAMRRRVRAQDRDDREEVARLRAQASQKRSRTRPSRRQGSFVDDVIETSTRVSESLEGVARSVSVAMDSFRGVARQATGVLSEFADTADQLRTALKGEPPRRTDPDAHASGRRASERDDHDRTHRL